MKDNKKSETHSREKGNVIVTNKIKRNGYLKCGKRRKEKRKSERLRESERLRTRERERERERRKKWWHTINERIVNIYCYRNRHKDDKNIKSEGIDSKTRKMKTTHFGRGWKSTEIHKHQQEKWF